jgi:peptidoglycan/LPS O-acetylase OafA/YrhL
VFKSSARYGDQLNSFDLLKLLALVTMIIDHVGDYILPDDMWLRAIGRLAFPLFLFLVGYSGSYKVKPDLIGWAALVVVTAAVTHHPVFPFNVLASIAVTRWVMQGIVSKPLTALRLWGIFIACLLLWPLTYHFSDYGTFAILFAICGYLQRHQPRALATHVCIVLTIALHFFIQSAMFHFDGAHFVGAGLVGVVTGMLMWRFRIEQVNVALLSSRLRRFLQWAARNTLPLYGLHVMILMVAERVCFPERLLHFRWI